jgi:drug/metabolite transporter (DMT)-like permease
MVFYRTLLATVGMVGLILFTKGTLSIPLRDAAKLISVGLLVGAHWIAFFASGQISTASVSLVGFATASFWTAILEPLSNNQKIRPLEISLGVFVVIGLYIIFQFDFKFFDGLLLGILSGLLLAIFAVINSHFIKHLPAYTITVYEMAGAFLFCVIFLPVYQLFWVEELNLSPTRMDWVYISILAIVCSVYAYSLSVELMKRISVFVIQLTLNLEPVYGIILAIFILDESRYLNLPFYIGTGIILLSVFIYPLVKSDRSKET